MNLEFLFPMETMEIKTIKLKPSTYPVASETYCSE